MADRDARFILKRSNLEGKIPTIGQLKIGELALNTADVKAYAAYTGGLSGATEIRQIGWDRLSTLSGGTVNGNVIINGSLSATTYYGDGSNLNIGGLNIITSTAVVTGGIISVNLDDTKIDISDGYGYIVDAYTDPENPTSTKVSWSGLTGITITNLATFNETFIAINSGGTVVQSTTPFDTEDVRDYIVLGVVSHFSNTMVDAVATNPITLTYPMNQLWDMASSLGIINKQGNVYSATGPNLFINKSFGKSFKIGLDYVNSQKAPNISINGPQSGLTFVYYYRDGVGGYVDMSASTIDPTMWDDGSGTLQSVPSGQYTTQRIYFDPALNKTFIHYGQILYSSISVAESSINTEVFSENPLLQENTALRCWLITRGNTTDLTDTSKAKFITAGKLGQVAAGSSTSTTNLQQAYDNSVEPEILTSALGKALTIKIGSGSDGDNLIEFYNSSDVLNSYITGEGNARFNNITGNTISATTYLGLPTDIRVTGGTYSNGTATFNNNVGGSFNVTGFFTGSTDSDTFVTGFTYSNNNLTISNNNGSSYTTNITTFTGITVNGVISSGGTNLDRLFLRNIPIDFVFDATYSTTSSSFASAPMTVVIQSASTYLNQGSTIKATLICDISQSDSGIGGEFELFNYSDSTSVTGSQTSFVAADGLKQSAEFTLATTDYNDTFRVRVRRVDPPGSSVMRIRGAQLILKVT